MSPTAISFGQVIPVTGPVLGFAGTVSRVGERVITARTFSPTTTTNNLNFGDPVVMVPTATGGTWDTVADFVAALTSNIGLVASYFAGFGIREVQTQLSYPAGQAPGVLQVGYYANGNIAEVLERGSGTLLLSVGAPSAGDQVYTRVALNTAVAAGLIGDWETNPVATDQFTLNGITAAAAAVTSITGITFTNVFVGMVVTGAGVAPGTYVVSGTGTAGAFTTIVLSKGLPVAITATSVLTFSNLVALPNVVARTGFVDANSMFEATIKTRNAA